MKKIIYLFTLASVLLVSCSKNDCNVSDVAHYDPSALNEVQENAIDVVEQYAIDNIESLKSGKMTKSEFYDNLRDSLAIYLNQATASLDWLGSKGGVPLDVCLDVLTTQRDSFASINVMTDTVGGSFKGVTYYEEEMSNAYHDLRVQHMDLRHSGLTNSLDLLHSNLMHQGIGTLSSSESNFLQSRIHPILGVHQMFESSKWDNLKDLFEKKDEKCFICFYSIYTPICIAAAEVAVTSVSAESLAAAGIFPITTININAQPVYGPNGDIVARQMLGLPHYTSSWMHNHINAVFASCSSLLSLVENHLDTE